MSSDQYHTCPICFESVSHWERYPLAVCSDCANKASDGQGRSLSFYNVSMSGGLKAIVTDTDEEHQSHTCYIQGVECRADEARFGGIIIEAVRESIGFYHLHQPYGFFSNFAPYAIYLKDRIWVTSEHYFQAQKFAGTPHEEQVRQSATPRVAAEMGRDRSRPLRSDWQAVKDATMREALYAKFTQHPDLTEKLLETNEARLVEHTRNDNYWGDGGDGSGKNRLGKLLMEIRDQIRRDLGKQPLQSLANKASHENSFTVNPGEINNVDLHNLNRFIKAQRISYEQALSELRNGQKRSHWMWYVFPQFDGLGSSTNSKQYSIKSVAEAEAYLSHPVLGSRLVECVKAVLRVEGRTAHEIFGSPDDMKLKSCATLFAYVSPPDSVFEQLLNKYFQGKQDGKTLCLLQDSGRGK